MEIFKHIIINENSRKPKYIQIVDSFTSNISRGILNINDKVPSINMLSEEFNLSRDTVEKAYKIFSNKFPDANYPKFDEDFIFIIEKAIGLIKPNIKLFNAGRGRSRIPTQIWSQAYARILIGGFGLDRGYTIKGLTITYLSRDKARQDDTLLQRARFFGYHKNYHQFLRVTVER